MIEKFTINIEQFADYPERRVYVYLPNNYYNTDKRYPVLYMFDGQNAFFNEDATYGKSWGLGDYLDYTDTEIIVAAIECNQSANHGRMFEYSPYDFENDYYGSVTGKGEETMDWLINTFKTQIDENYRTLTDRDNTYILGSSMGGLMAIYALIKHNDVFSKAAALSASFWPGSEQLKQLIINSPLNDNTVLYMDKGEEEVAGRMDSLKSFAIFSSLLMCKGVKVTSRIVPKGTHSEASWEKQIPVFMKVFAYNGD